MTLFPRLDGTLITKKGVYSIAFASEDCSVCPLRDQCPVEPGKKRHYLRFHCRALRLAGRRAREHTSEFRDKYRWRSGIEATFSEISELADLCRFRDCRHQGEPGCAVEAAVAEGRIGAERLASWHKLLAEERHNSETLAEARDRSRKFGRMVRHSVRDKRRMRGLENSD